MHQSKSNFKAIAPVLFAFFIMGFCDIIGKASDYIKVDFNLTDSVTGFLPAMVFIWFLFLSIPTGSLMNRIGRKNTVIFSMVITIVGLMLPLVYYSLYSCLIAFALIGIGNTILQVSLNPLISNLVHKDKFTSALSAGQVIKALSSLFGPYILSVAYMQYAEKWYYALPMLGVLTLLSMLWLWSAKIPNDSTKAKEVSFKEVFALLGNAQILMLFLGILFVVGLDVGINYIGSKLLIGRCSEPTTSSAAQTVYFSSKLIGTFIGAFLLTKISEVKYFRFSITVAVLAMVALFFVNDSKLIIITLIGIIGFACSCIFPIIFSQAIKIMPDKMNEISGLMITGISGGALIPPLMGILTSTTDAFGMLSQAGGIVVLLVCLLYLAYLAFGKLKYNTTN